MAVAQRQRKEKACENGTKENPRTRLRTSGEKTALLASPVYIGQAQEEETKHIKRGAKIGPLLLGQPVFTARGVISFTCQIKPSWNRAVTLVHHFESLLWRDRTEEITHSPDA